MTIVFKISDNLKNMVIKYYEKYIPLKTPPYAVFQVKIMIQQLLYMNQVN